MLEYRGRRAESLGRDAHREWKRAIVRTLPFCPGDDPRRMTLNDGVQTEPQRGFRQWDVTESVRRVSAYTIKKTAP